MDIDVKLYNYVNKKFIDIVTEKNTQFKRYIFNGILFLKLIPDRNLNLPLVQVPVRNLNLPLVQANSLDFIFLAYVEHLRKMLYIGNFCTQKCIVTKTIPM